MHSLLVVNVGNTRTQIGRAIDGEITGVERLGNTDRTAILEKILAEWKRESAPVLIASVNESVGEPLATALRGQIGQEVYVVGEDVPVPVGRQLDPETITGVDRLLNAAAAWDKLRQACIVVDAGTAMTVDFVDGEGTFHGGAICPGAAMQLRALHEQTAALPELTPAAPDDEPFGRSTTQAMLQGVFHGMRSTVQRLVERYSEAYGAFPTVIATGGDAELLFADEPLVQHVVPDLCLRGIAITARHALAGGEVEGGDAGA